MIDVREMVERETGQPVTEETRLDSLGLDSLDFLDLLLLLQGECGKTLPDERVAELETVGDLARELA